MSHTTFVLDGKKYVIVPQEDYDATVANQRAGEDDASRAATRREIARRKRVGRQIRKLRQESGMSQAKMAKFTRRDQSTWSQIENGDREYPYLQRVLGEVKQLLKSKQAEPAGWLARVPRGR